MAHPSPASSLPSSSSPPSIYCSATDAELNSRIPTIAVFDDKNDLQTTPSGNRNDLYLTELHTTSSSTRSSRSNSGQPSSTASSPVVFQPRQRRPSRFSLRQMSVSAGSAIIDENNISTAAAYYDAVSPDLTFSQKSAERNRRVSEIMEGGVRAAAAAAARSASLDNNNNRIAEEDEAAVRAAAGLMPKRMTYFLLALLCTTNFCLSMMSSLIAPFFPNEVLHKGGTAFLSGVILSCFDGTRFFLAPIFGHYVYAIGARFMLIAGPFMAAWCSILFGLNGMTRAGPMFFWLAAIVRIVSAFGSGMYGITSVSVRPVLFAGFVSFAFSLLRACVTLGVIIGPAIGGALYSLGGFGLPFYVLGGFSMCLTAMQAWAIPDLERLESAAITSKVIQKAEENAGIENENSPALAANASKKPSFWGLCRNPRIFFCMFMYCSFGFTTTFYSTNISLHVEPLVGSVARVGYIILIAGVAEVMISPIVGYALDRGVSAKLMVVIGYALCIVGLLVMGPTPLIPLLSTSLWMVIIGTAIYGFGIGFGFTAPYNLATRAALASGFPPNQQTFGLLAGCMQTFFTFGCFLGPLTGGAMHDKVGFPWSATIVAAYLVFMMLLSIGNTVVLFIRDRRKLRSTVVPIDATH